MIDRPADPQQIHRWAIFSALTGVEAGEILDHRVFDTLISHPEGMFKGTPSQARRVWLINQVSHCDNQLAARWQTLLRPELTLSAIWFGAVQETPAIRHLIRRLTR